ncbi:hypothetical protein Sango_0192600 [Sesamum angolense]|uniref:Retrovirus-related Pol polyprotein from transposon TNT 1-94-like beta-barrel domain-containing protein n=1 Tax=Sesamum angolense TaxID=2727404 RepID=A0AAE1XGV0_9LAMI|nr:hypothetical protein Sango_0192600 [Sesamum angolense]
MRTMSYLKEQNHLENDCYFRGKPQCRKCKKIWTCVKKIVGLKEIIKANCIEENNSSDQLFYTCNSVAETGEATWYIDSAASNHMTQQRSFSDMDESFKTNVKLGDNHIVKVEGKGSVGYKTQKRETAPKLGRRTREKSGYPPSATAHSQRRATESKQLKTKKLISAEMLSSTKMHVELG